MFRRLSLLEDVRHLFFKRWPNCPRCGDEKLPFPPYAEGPRFRGSSGSVAVLNLDGMGVTPVCERCWNELPPEGRFQWLLLLMSCWALSSPANGQG